MRTLMLVAIFACGCAHHRGGAWTGTDAIIVAGLIAVEMAIEPPPPQGPLCSDDDIDPPHTCPSTTPALPEK
jgi:hypothetical protein